MLILGPGTVERGLVPSTGLVACRGMALLGPAVGEVAPPDPISHLFLVVGKILALRRVLEVEHSGTGVIRNVKGLQVATIDQAVDGQADDWSAWELVWSPLAHTLADHVPPLEAMVQQADHTVRQVMMRESVRILGLDPELSAGDKVQAVIDYMTFHGLTVQAQAHGFRDYLMRMFRDGAGLPAAFPASTAPVAPNFPDAWITSDVVVPDGVAMPWVMVL